MMNERERARARERVRGYANRVLLSIDLTQRVTAGDVVLEMMVTNLKGLALAINELADVSESQE